MPKRLYTHKGKAMTVKEWAKATGVARQTIYTRLSKGWPAERVFSPERYKHVKRRALQSVSEQQPFVQLHALTVLQQMMHSHQRKLHRTIRAFIRDIESQAAELRLELDGLVTSQTAAPDNLGMGVVQKFLESAPDRLSSVAEDRG